MGTPPEVINVTKKLVMKGTDEDPQLMAPISVATSQANTYNVDKLKETANQYKEKMVIMKDTMVKEEEKGRK